MPLLALAVSNRLMESEGVLRIAEVALEVVPEGGGLVRVSPNSTAASCRVGREFTRRIPLSRTAGGMVR
jgi:hypothetical protein